ncbi:MAG TPA: hypothetical protein DCY13_17540 [Verrucomicrobiales bacterium]|nr:hypothetical protein [Verrucomicrobiales bacterium]
MNEQEQLKLQAYLDGELTGRDRREVTAWLDAREDARAMLTNLQHVRAALRGNEPEHRLDCTREFYWQNIARGIESAFQEPGAGVMELVLRWLRHHLRQLATAGIGMALVIFAFTFVAGDVQADSEWEVLHPDTGMVNYRDYQNGLTVVMVYDRSTPGFAKGD